MATASNDGWAISSNVPKAMPNLNNIPIADLFYIHIGDRHDVIFRHSAQSRQMQVDCRPAATNDPKLQFLVDGC